MAYKNPHANKAHEQRKARMKDETIIKGSRPNVETKVDRSRGDTGHLDHRTSHEMKPSRSSTDRTDLQETWLMKNATDGKLSCVDGHTPDNDSFGWKPGQFKDSGLANNVVNTAKLSTHPDSTKGHGTDVFQAPPESYHPRLSPMKTVTKMVWSYKEPKWC